MNGFIELISGESSMMDDCSEDSFRWAIITYFSLTEKTAILTCLTLFLFSFFN
jgi:hypothetical protein